MMQNNAVQLEDILSLADELKQLKSLIDGLIIPLNKSTYLLEKKKLEQELQSLCFLYLSQDNPQFENKLKQNRELLCNTGIVFKAYKNSVGYKGSHAKSFEGKIHANGYLYLETTSINSRFDIFSSGRTPVQYRGTLDPLGDSLLTLSKTEWLFWGSKIPREYLGSIDINGQMKIETVVSEYEWWGSEQYVSHVVADPFKGDADKTELFLENKEVLEIAYQDFCKTKLIL